MAGGVTLCYTPAMVKSETTPAICSKEHARLLGLPLVVLHECEGAKSIEECVEILRRKNKPDILVAYFVYGLVGLLRRETRSPQCTRN
jgi:hypothetical protein